MHHYRYLVVKQITLGTYQVRERKEMQKFPGYITQIVPGDAFFDYHKWRMQMCTMKTSRVLDVRFLDMRAREYFARGTIDWNRAFDRRVVIVIVGDDPHFHVSWRLLKLRRDIIDRIFPDTAYQWPRTRSPVVNHCVAPSSDPHISGSGFG